MDKGALFSLVLTRLELTSYMLCRKIMSRHMSLGEPGTTTEACMFL